MTPVQAERARRTVQLNIPALVALILAAGVIGGIVASHLPFGAKSPTVERGMAFRQAGGGTFQADRGGVTAGLRSDVGWLDRAGNLHEDSVPPCLAGPDADAVTQAEVEAAYVWVRLPGGGSHAVVTWIRCL